MTYIDGFVLPVPMANREEYFAMARQAAPIFLEHGALQFVECWGDDLPRGKQTDFHMAVKAEEAETVVFSFVVWPSREARDAGNAAIMADPRMIPPEAHPFDAKRMIWGGFTTVVDERA